MIKSLWETLCRRLFLFNLLFLPKWQKIQLVFDLIEVGRTNKKNKIMEVSKFNTAFLPSFFRGFDEDFFSKSSAANISKVAVNIIDQDSGYVVEMAVPGFKKEDIHIELDGNKLSIRGEVKESKEVKEENYTHREFSCGEFTRSFTLPKDVDTQKIEADYKDGVLKINVPKPEVQQKVVKKIEVK